MNRLLTFGVILGGLLSFPAHAQVVLSVDGEPAIQTESPITSIVYRPAARRLEVQTAWDDLRCVPNPDGPAVNLPIPQPGDFVFALDQLPGDLDGEYVIEADGTIAQLVPAISGNSGTLSVITSESRINDCNGSDCAVLICAPGGTPIFSGDFEPIAADLGVSWDTVPSGGPLELVAGDAAGSTITLSAFNAGQLDATSVTVDLDVLLPGSGNVACPAVISGGGGFAFDVNCSGAWTIGDLNAGEQVEMQLLYTADAASTIGEQVTADAVIDSPTVADINLTNNAVSADLDVVKSAALEFNIISFPQSQIDLNSGPASVSFSVLASPQGPSILNSVVDIALQYPSGSGVTLIESDVDFIPPIWSPLFGTNNEELLFDFSIGSFEPGVDAFCVDVISVAGVPGASVSVAGTSITERCLDVIGPETIDLTAQVTGAASVVAGIDSGVNPGNLLQTIELSNNNATFDADDVEVLVQLDVPAGANLVGTPSVSLGSISQAGGDWQWSVPLLSAGETAIAEFWYDIPALVAENAEVTTTLASVSIDPAQILANPVPTTAFTSVVAREIDLLITSGESADPVAPGGTLVYVFEAANVGPSNGSAITLDFTEILPPGVTITSETPNFLGSYSNGVWTIPVLGADAAISPTLTVTLDVGSGAAPGTGVISGTVAVTGSNETRINTSNDSSTETTSIQ